MSRNRRSNPPNFDLVKPPISGKDTHHTKKNFAKRAPSVLRRRWRDDVELSGLGGQRRLVEVVEVGVLKGVNKFILVIINNYIIVNIDMP